MFLRIWKIAGGYFFDKYSIKADWSRIRVASHQSTEKVKKQRKRRRGIKKKWIDVNKDKEGDGAYQSGSFWS